MEGFLERSMADYPSINDRDYDLWKKIAWNFYNYALTQGSLGLKPPSIHDTEYDLQKKVVSYTSSLA